MAEDIPWSLMGTMNWVAVLSNARPLAAKNTSDPKPRCRNVGRD